MKIRFSIFLVSIWALFLTTGGGLAQIELQGNNYLEYSLDRKTDEKYFEDWTDVYLKHQNWRIGLRYEFHLPPQPYSQDTIGQGVSQRFVEYHTKNLAVTIGNYYSLFGRGLVLRSFDSRTLRWDTNIDGVKFKYHSKYVDIQALGGRPRDRRGRRFEPLQGTELKLKPHPAFHFGGSYITTKLNSKGKVNWGALFGSMNLNWGSFYAERAFKDYPEQFPKGSALYMMGNLFVGLLGALVEYRDYDHFDLTEGLTYNNPPSVIREHQYTLLNRHQRVQDANDEEGYLVELTYTLGDMGVLTLNHNRTENHDNLLLYREYYGQLELDPTDDWNLVGGSGEQKDLEARYLNFLGSVKCNVSDYNSIKFIYEHQHAKIRLTDRQFYNLAFALSFAHSPIFTISILGERTTDQVSDKKFWVGGQLDVNFLENFDLTIFGGTRRKGKICAGGVCIVRPEFEGVEFTLINRF
ncbi:hypothetical protein ISS37_07485 [candidate division KSB1 bacterium]|nr:hypothetical protein [candidate division KSB1 bacterium]